MAWGATPITMGREQEHNITMGYAHKHNITNILFKMHGQGGGCGHGVGHLLFIIYDGMIYALLNSKI